MEQVEFRKLNVDLPREPIRDDHPWFIAGLLFALAFIALVTYAFLKYKRLF